MRRSITAWPLAEPEKFCMRTELFHAAKAHSENMTGIKLRPDVAEFLHWFARHARGPLSACTPKEARRRNLRLHQRWERQIPSEISRKDMVMDGPGGPLRMRLHDGGGDKDAGPVMVYFHGGGFVVGDLDTHSALCATIARDAGMKVVSVDYRLAPEHPWPAAPDDAESATRWVAENIPGTGLVLAGDSAGGTLAIVTALALRDRPAARPVLAQWPIYPAVTPGTRGHSFEAYGEGHFLTRDDLAWFFTNYAANVRHWRATPIRVSQAGLPPTLIYTAQCDPLADQGKAYAAQCAQAGVPTRHIEGEGAIHGILTLRQAMPSGEEDLARCITALKEMIAQ